MTSGWYLKNDKAVIMIAHRLKTVQKAERIFAFISVTSSYQNISLIGHETICADLAFSAKFFYYKVFHNFPPLKPSSR